MERMNFFMQYAVIIIRPSPGGILADSEVSKLSPDKKIGGCEEGQPAEKPKHPI